MRSTSSNSTTTWSSQRSRDGCAWASISRLFPNRAISAQEQQDIDRWLDLAREAPAELMTELGMADLLKVGLQSETSLWEFLPELAWRVVFSSQTRYIITDKPVTSFKLQDGANDPRFELFIPLSTRCTLHISRQGKPRTLQTDIVDEALARTLNTRTLTGAYRFVFCSREETWVSKNAHRHPSQVRTPGVRWGVSDIISIPYGEHCKLCGHVFTEQEFNDADISYSGKVRRWNGCVGNHKGGATLVSAVVREGGRRRDGASVMAAWGHAVYPS